MNTWKTLYIKELKDNRTLFLVLVVMTAFLEVVAVWSVGSNIDMWSPDIQGVNFSPHFMWSVVPYGVLLILPFLLSHSFVQEVKGQTHYLLLSLPVSRTQIFAAKAAAVATLGIVLFALSSAGFITVLGELHALATRVAETSSHALHFPLFSDIAVDILIISGVFYLSAMAVMLGIAGGVAGLKLVVRRFAGLASTAFAILGVLYCYFSTLPEVLSLPEIFGTYEVPFWIGSTIPGAQVDMDSESIEISFTFLAYSILVGLASMGIGMWLFEKRAEA